LACNSEVQVVNLNCCSNVVGSTWPKNGVRKYGLECTFFKWKKKEKDMKEDIRREESVTAGIQVL